MKSKHIWWLALCGVAVLVVAIMRRPVLFQLFAETGCACGDYHDEVTGWIVLNPFRDRSPENRATEFLEDLRNGRCVVGDSVCAYALQNYRVSDWRLENRGDHKGRVQLYYRLTKYGMTEPKHKLTGEGVVELAGKKGSWTVIDCSAYF